MSTDSNGTVDVTALVDQLKTTWARWATLTVSSAARAVPWLAWLNLPIISQLFDLLVSKIVGAIADALEMQAFFLNTAIRKASQAQDFIDAVAAKNALPPTATLQEIKNAEAKQLSAFRNFVLLSN